MELADLLVALQPQLEAMMTTVDSQFESFHNSLKQQGFALESKLVNLRDDIYQYQPRSASSNSMPAPGSGQIHQ